MYIANYCNDCAPYLKVQEISKQSIFNQKNAAKKEYCIKNPENHIIIIIIMKFYSSCDKMFWILNTPKNMHKF